MIFWWIIVHIKVIFMHHDHLCFLWDFALASCRKIELSLWCCRKLRVPRRWYEWIRPCNGLRLYWTLSDVETFPEGEAISRTMTGSLAWLWGTQFVPSVVVDVCCARLRSLFGKDCFRASAENIFLLNLVTKILILMASKIPMKSRKCVVSSRK